VICENVVTMADSWKAKQHAEEVL